MDGVWSPLCSPGETHRARGMPLKGIHAIGPSLCCQSPAPVLKTPEIGGLVFCWDVYLLILLIHGDILASITTNA